MGENFLILGLLILLRGCEWIILLCLGPELSLYLFSCSLSATGLAAFWGVVAIGLFADGDNLLDLTRGHAGLFKGNVHRRSFSV